MKNILSLPLILLFPYCVFSQDMWNDLEIPTETMEYINSPYINIEPECKNEYPNDVEMYRYCVRNEAESKAKVTLKLSGSPNDILNYCYKANDKWSGREYCIESEIKAKNNTFKLAIGVLSEKRRECIAKWNTWSMREYCMKKLR